jgi:hypothetical protein
MKTLLRSAYITRTHPETHMAEKAVGALNNGGYSVQAASMSWGFWRIRSTRCSTGTQDDQHDVQGVMHARRHYYGSARHGEARDQGRAHGGRHAHHYHQGRARHGVDHGRGRVHDDRHVRRHHQGGARRGEDDQRRAHGGRCAPPPPKGVRRGWAERMWELPMLQHDMARATWLGTMTRVAWADEGKVDGEGSTEHTFRQIYSYVPPTIKPHLSPTTLLKYTP